jgi:hypothetical protein
LRAIHREMMRLLSLGARTAAPPERAAGGRRRFA